MDTYYCLRGESLVNDRAARDAGIRVALTPEPGAFALGLKSRVPLSPAAVRLLKEIKQRAPTEFIPRYNIRVLHTERTDRAIDVLAPEPAVEFVTPVFHHSPKSKDPLFVTSHFIVQFLPEVTLDRIEQFNARYDVSIVRRLGVARNTYVLRAPGGGDGRNALDLANLYFESGMTLFSHPDFVTRKHFKSQLTLNRPVRTFLRGEFSPQQWHLRTAKVTDAWAITKGDPGITIAVMDDGVDTSHPEFAGKLVWQHDYEDDVDDAYPKLASDKHGTACAGVATAGGVKADGSAPGCSLMAIRTPSDLGVSDEAQMFQDAVAHGADVISCSWGPGDGTGSVDPLPDATRVTIHYCQTNGRGGKGIPICWAAGNGNELVTNDGYASNPEVMAIAASTSQEQKSWYSDFGPEIAIAAPSNGDGSGGDKSIFTTDRIGANGYNTGDAAKGDATGSYFNGFGGTSSATPLVAGVVGLMLSANRSLTSAEVRDILQSTADKIGATSDYDASGHSQFYGYGRVNTLAAVQEAKRRVGEGGGDTAGQVPTISAPETVDFSGEPPTFMVNPGSNGFYQIEIVVRSELFAQTTGRDASTYFASWDEGPFLAVSSYALPASAWAGLKSAERLYYRVWTSSSNAEWVDTMVSVADEEAASAPFIAIVGGMSGDDSSSGSGSATQRAPTITAPATVEFDGQPPMFAVDPGSNSFYQVEVAARPELFVEIAGRDAFNYFASWDEEPFLAVSVYTLPESAWSSLKSAERLYYRVWSTSSGSNWVNTLVSTDDVDAASAPSIVITGGVSRSAKPSMPAKPESGTPSSSRRYERDLHGKPARAASNDGPPSIAATEHHLRSGDAPVFRIEPNGRSHYEVEISTRAALLDAGRRGSKANSAEFYASPRMRIVDGAPAMTLTMPNDAWKAMRRAERLYYRVIASLADGSASLASTQDADAESAPWIVLVDDIVGRNITVAQDHDEHLWSSRQR